MDANEKKSKAEAATTKEENGSSDNHDIVNPEQLDIIQMHELKKIVKEDFGREDM